MSLVINGYSESSLLNTLKSLNLPYSDDELNKIKDDLKSELDLFKQRELPESVFLIRHISFRISCRQAACPGKYHHGGRIVDTETFFAFKKEIIHCLSASWQTRRIQIIHIT